MEDKALAGPSELRAALAALGEILAARDLHYEVVVVGGAGLALLGVIDRPTRDVDVVATWDGGAVVPITALPSGLADAVRDVARIYGLNERWLNVGPASLMDLGLPSGFAERLKAVGFGALTVYLASRTDQIAFKLYAAVDQGPRSRHLADLVVLRPTNDELLAAARWTRTHDPSDGFRHELRLALQHFGVEDVDL